LWLLINQVRYKFTANIIED